MGLELRRRPRWMATIGDFMRERYGQEVVDYLAEPLLSGSTARPGKMSLRSVLPRFVSGRSTGLSRGVWQNDGARRSLFHLRGGLQVLVDAGGCADVVYGRAEAVELARRVAGVDRSGSRSAGV
jgi:protoporphyrinogen oxidase